MNWTRFIIRRLLLIGASLLVLSALVFFIMEVIPGDLARTILGAKATPEQVQALRVQLALDKPAYVRYWLWLSGVLKGDFGESISLHAPVGPILLRRVAHSLVLGVVAAIIGLPLAIFLGFVAGMRRPPWLDQLLSRIAVIIGSLPEFLVAVLLVVLFSHTLGWLPSTGIVRTGSPLEDPRILILPMMTLVLVMTAYNLRITRASVVNVLETEFAVAAELKRLPLLTIMWRHVAPNALLPSITVAASYLGWLIGGLIVVEAVFAYPGLGLLVWSAARASDVPVLEAAVLLVGGFRMLANLGADILYMILDPRVRIS